REAQLSAAEEAVVSPVPDCPWPEAVLSPLHVGAASVTRCVGGIPRCTGMLGLIEPRQREEAQSCCPENDPAPRRPRRVAHVTSLHARSMACRAQGSFRNTGAGEVPVSWPRAAKFQRRV